MKFLYFFETLTYKGVSLQLLRYYEPFNRHGYITTIREVKSRIDKLHFRFPFRFKTENNILWWR
jgi:hypothetical protein